MFLFTLLPFTLSYVRAPFGAAAIGLSVVEHAAVAGYSINQETVSPITSFPHYTFPLLVARRVI